ncbi:MAG: TfoX/Sxy family DNA transformation protein, partial [Boseongicola sp.]|nr:TfoX/Sxy family DNA transformation protein [Boseongicola sp.]
MTDPVSSIRNLGPASDVAFARAGITSADDLRALDPDEAYF